MTKSGYILVESIEGVPVETFVTCQDDSDWYTKVRWSGDLACRYLRDKVVDKTRLMLVLFPGTTVPVPKICKTGFMAKMHIEAFLEKPSRNNERKLRNSVRYWTKTFPEDQDDLLLKWYADHMSHVRQYPPWDAKDVKYACPLCGTWESFQYPIQGQPPPPPRLLVCDDCKDNRNIWRLARAAFQHEINFFFA
jgi:hypothetical protein